MTPALSSTLVEDRKVAGVPPSRLFPSTSSLKTSRAVLGDSSRAASARPGPPETKDTPGLPITLDSPVQLEAGSWTSPSLPFLRRTSTMYADLRAAALRQGISRPISPLLPSPVLREAPVVEDSCFSPRGPQTRSSMSDDGSMDGSQILAYYCDNPTDNEKPEAQTSSEDDNVRAMLMDDDGTSTSSEAMPPTPVDRNFSAALGSDESGWLAGTKSHEERMRRFRARCYQIVQRPWTGAAECSGDNEVMIATVLVGPGKARLVQIQRPSRHEDHSESTATAPATPSTPAHPATERSAFSPYDTPDDPHYIPRHRPTTPTQSRLYTSASEMYPHYSRSPGTPSHRDVDIRCTVSGRDVRFHDFDLQSPDMINNRRNPRDPYRRCKACFRFDSCLKDRYVFPSSTAGMWASCRKLDRVLVAVTRAIDSFPDALIRLDSPDVLELRNSRISDETYISALQRVFPTAPALLLSALAGWILVDLYLDQVKTQPVAREQHSAWDPPSDESLHRIPHKAREMLGIGLPSDRWTRTNESTLRGKANAIRASTVVIGQRLIESLRGSWDADIWHSLRVLVEVIEATRSGPEDYLDI